MTKMKLILSKLIKPIAENKLFFISIWILCFLSGDCINFAKLLTGQFQFFKYTIEVFLISSFCSYLITTIYSILPKNVKKIYSSLFCIIYFILIIGKVYLFYTFRLHITSQLITVIAETNSDEAAGFLETYFSFKIILLALTVIALLIIIILLARYLVKKFYQRSWLYFIGTFCIIGLILYSVDIFKLCKWYSISSIKGKIEYIKELPYIKGEVISYLIISAYMHHQIDMLNILQLREISTQKLKVDKVNNCKNVILIIGESFSRSYSSLYGYYLNTNPKLQARKDNLFVFNNVICFATYTSRNFQFIFSMAGSDMEDEFSEKPLLPQIFRDAGYINHLYSNQYVAAFGVSEYDESFMTDKKLSDLLFHNRNQFLFTGKNADEQLIPTIQTNDSTNFYIIHFMGNHYPYNVRYPDEFNHFSIDSIHKQTSDDHKQIIANYDNALLYNDFIVDAILNKFENVDAVAIYISDHGEDVYENDNFMGHGTFSKNVHEIPFIIWTSNIFKQSHPEITEKIANSLQRPYMTDDIGHTILELAGLKCEYFDETRSIINKEFNSNRIRMLNEGVDYNTLK
jgi:heptose-I-phosphate ethanolaminephosphotransferase